MVLFEIHQRFKGQFFNELHASFKQSVNVETRDDFVFQK